LGNPKRPLLPYFGGKWLLAPWIISHFPPHQAYIEPFAGAASVLLRKPRVKVEVTNDLDREVYNLFRMLRDRGDELKRLLELTPYSRSEFELSYKPARSNIEKARRLIVKCHLGFSSSGNGKAAQRTGFATNDKSNSGSGAYTWVNWQKHIDSIIERLRGVVIECRPGIDIIMHQKRHDALYYCDPPYVHSTRRSGSYSYEMTEEDHAELAEALNSVEAMVVLSGYRSELYDRLYPGWHRSDTKAFAAGARGGRTERTECLWLNQRCWDALNHKKYPLFEVK